MGRAEKNKDMELEQEPLFNRTGIMTNPALSVELIEGARNTVPSSAGDGSEMADNREKYLDSTVPIGSSPVIINNPEASGPELSEEADRMSVLLDKLGERLAFERQGTRLYEAVLQKLDSLVLEDESGPSSEDLQHICDEELDHFKLLQKTIAGLGGDSTAQTPGADVAAVLSHGMVQIVTDPRTTVLQMLQAVLNAELMDNDGWDLLIAVCKEAGQGDLEEQFRNAREQEREHLQKVRRWLSDMTIDELNAANAAEDEEAPGREQRKGGTETEGTDALELLRQDHENVKELFEEIEGAEERRRKQLFKQIKKELDTHTRIEEKIFYPAVEKYEQLKDMVLESREEHKQIKTLLREIQKLASNSERFEPKLKVLKENVQHHAEEEEENKMFPAVRELLSPAQLQELGAELEAAKSSRRSKRR